MYSLWTQPAASITSLVWSLRQEEVRWTLLLHIRRAIWDHECPLTCSSSLQVTPGMVLPPPLAEIGTLLSPRECQLKQTPASLLELQCLSKSGQHLKDLGVRWSGLWERHGLGTDFFLALGSMGQPLRLGLSGRDIAADQPTKKWGVTK